MFCSLPQMENSKSLDIAEFVFRAAPIFPLDAIKFVLSEIIEPKNIWLWVEGSKVKAICWYIDSFDNYSDSAEIEIFIPPEYIDLYPLVLSKLWSNLPPITRSNIEIPLRLQHPIEERVLKEYGFSHAFNLFAMHRDTPFEISTSPVNPKSESRFSWSVLTDERMTAYRETVRECFEGIPGMSLADPNTFAEMQKGFQNKPMLLMDEENQIAGFYRIHLHGSGIGEVSLIGRNIHYKGKGVGSILLHNALAGLTQLGARCYSLEVAAMNEKAIDLYKRYGFRMDHKIQFWRTPVNA